MFDVQISQRVSVLTPISQTIWFKVVQISSRVFDVVDRWINMQAQLHGLDNMNLLKL